jgi:hypothetical protein
MNANLEKLQSTKEQIGVSTIIRQRGDEGGFHRLQLWRQIGSLRLGIFERVERDDLLGDELVWL